MTLTPVPTPRQTIPYAYRPIVKQNLVATDDFYQFLERLRVGTGQTIQNINNIIVQSNASEAEITALQIEVANLQSIIALIEEEIAALQAQTPEVPPIAPAALPVRSAFPPVAPRLPSSLPSPPAAALTRITVEQFLGLDFTNAPTADPGNGRPWLKVGNLHVGA